MQKEQYYGTGRRKTAQARVFLTLSESQNGHIAVNGKKLNDFFGRAVARTVVEQPLKVTEMMGNFDANITVKGGGTFGQGAGD